MMFAFGTYIPTHRHCCNPFGATIANPRINFALGIAAATSMPFVPVYRPFLPVFGYGFNSYNQTPAFGAVTGQNYLHLFNQLPQTQQINITQATGNPFVQSAPAWLKDALKGTTQITDFSALFKPSTSTTNGTSTVDNSEISTEGTKLNRSGNDYGPEFLAKVKEIAQRLDCDYRDLLGLMNSESGIRADIKNPNGSASGLIQFIESTARSLGTTTAELRAMKPIDQLDYVERYLTNAKRNAGISGKLSAGDLYTLVFLPGRINRNVVTSSGEDYYAKNKGLDLNNDGQITKTELGQRIHNKRVSDNSFLA
jgi:hypothetical protein